MAPTYSLFPRFRSTLILLIYWGIQAALKDLHAGTFMPEPVEDKGKICADVSGVSCMGQGDGALCGSGED